MQLIFRLKSQACCLSKYNFLEHFAWTWDGAATPFFHYLQPKFSEITFHVCWVTFDVVNYYVGKLIHPSFHVAFTFLQPILASIQWPFNLGVTVQIKKKFKKVKKKLFLLLNKWQFYRNEYIKNDTSLGVIRKCNIIICDNTLSRPG